MSDPLYIVLFLFLVFAPCAVAFLSGDLVDSALPGTIYLDKWKRPRNRGERPETRESLFEELPLAEDFEIRSFPKGISQRRIVVRDTEGTAKLTIAQVRVAAVELLKLGGVVVAHELALVAAAMVSATQTAAEAAREALEAARNAYAWFAWGDAMAGENYVNKHWSASPPQYEVRVEIERQSWRPISQAA
jgi:hypothetical protein